VSCAEIDQARASIFDYIEVFYNRERRHSHIGGVSPVEFERRGSLLTGCL
jgi:putative transposase